MYSSTRLLWSTSKWRKLEISVSNWCSQVSHMNLERQSMHSQTRCWLLSRTIATLFRDVDKYVTDEVMNKLLPKQFLEMNEKFFKICKISTTSLMSLVEDILDLAKIEAGTFSLNEQQFKVRSLVEEVRYSFEFQCEQKGIYFKIELDHSLLDDTFCSDVGRIKQVLNNLISNACKFTLQGGITLYISLKTIFDPDSFERVNYRKTLCLSPPPNDQNFSKLRRRGA